MPVCFFCIYFIIAFAFGKKLSPQITQISTDYFILIRFHSRNLPAGRQGPWQYNPWQNNPWLSYKKNTPTIDRGFWCSPVVPNKNSSGSCAVLLFLSIQYW
jgi:hypothetical protein